MRRLLGVIATLSLVFFALFAAFAAYHRSALRLPDSGAGVRARSGATTELETIESPTSVSTLLQLTDADGPVTTAWLRVPRRLDPDYAILMTYVGHKTGRKILELIPQRPDVVLVAMQYSAVYRHATLRQQLALPSVVAATVHDTVVGGMLAVAELERRGFDSSRLTVLGVSVGSFFAVLHGAYDEAVPRVLVVHGGGDIHGVLATMYASRGQPWRGHWVGALGYLFLDPYDSLHHVQHIAPRSFTMIATRGDGYFPEESARQLYARAGAPKAIAWSSGAHVRSKRLDIVDDLVLQIDAYFDGRLRFDQSESRPSP
jgi:hypothetical protein